MNYTKKEIVNHVRFNIWKLGHDLSDRKARAEALRHMEEYDPQREYPKGPEEIEDVLFAMEESGFSPEATRNLLLSLAVKVTTEMAQRVSTLQDSAAAIAGCLLYTFRRFKSIRWGQPTRSTSATGR